jgi:hypothetical protein
VRNSVITTKQLTVLQEKLLISATAWQRKPRNTTVRAGTDIVGYLEQFLGASKKSQPVIEAFIKVIGTEWAGICCPDKYEKGTLSVQCQPGPCMHFLKTEQANIIAAIKNICPTAKLRALRFIIKH